MERIDIITRFSSNGSLIPLEFTAGDRTVKIMDLGRQWETDEGRHMLVMDYQGKTFHIFFQLFDLSWYWVKDIKPTSGPA